MIGLAAAAAPQMEAGRVDRCYLAAMGDDFESSLRARMLAEQDAFTVFAAGVHPQNAEKYAASRTCFAIFRGHPKLRAVGELGLDYYYDCGDHGCQRRVLAEFLNAALEWRLPAVIHLRDEDGKRDAYADALSLLTDFARSGGRFVVHCYAGSAADLEKFLALGAWVGVTGMVTFRKAENIRMNLPLIPKDKLLLETDAPYLAPVPHRGEVNHSGFLVLTARKVAEVLGETVEETAARTAANAMAFYGVNAEAFG